VTTVKATFLVDHAEQRFLLEDAFGLAEEEVSTGVEGVMKTLTATAPAARSGNRSARYGN
jgi:hypothetical protein